jgi:MFS family permease
MSTTMGNQELPWYRTLSKKHWLILLATNLGWMFDGFENFALILTAGSAFRQLLDPSLHGSIPFYIGSIIAINLFGWAVGGVLGGVMADYIGRKKMMIISILAYSIMTGLSSFAWDFWSFAILRFLVGVAVGSEWATGSSMMAELWPDNARGKGAGLMQCGLGIGFFIASVTWLYVSPMGPDAWRYMYLIGVLPALLTLWIRRAIPESEIWEEVNKKRVSAVNLQKSGTSLNDDQTKLAKFTLVDLFTDKSLRKQTIILFLMSLTSTVGFWGIATWVPPFIASIAAASGKIAPQWASYAGMAYTAGSVAGYVSFGFLADKFGRKPITITFFVISLIVTPIFFFLTKDLTWLLALAFVTGAFTNGQFTWMASWLPELYPTRVRATALAFVFNAPRFIACLGPLLGGTMIVAFGGFGMAAMVLASIYILGIIVTPMLKETNGQPLPK